MSREQLADRRHQDLIEAVRLRNQETLVALNAAWQSPSTTSWGAQTCSQRLMPTSLIPRLQDFCPLFAPHNYGNAFQYQQEMARLQPPSQGTALVDFITGNLDHLMTVHQCDNIIILGNLNPPGIRNTFNSLLVVFDLHNHITFPTHLFGSSLNPMVMDFSLPQGALLIIGSHWELRSQGSLHQDAPEETSGQENHLHPLAVGGGVSQGSVLRPLLWNVYINDLLSLVPKSMVYVDDITMALAFNPGMEDSTTSHLNTTLRHIEE
ncbi:hypothetical protein O3P69_012090 [Scylla paramamosain]|uniref:Reverse transcriptase domain-containing protein n=1 Tax=Scylla paramamosain TaxID=85552 RepID=A0AAW0TCM9_SCYPA